MATLEEISGIEGFIRRRVELERKTHEQISEAVQQLYPGTKGLSSRSVRRFCNNHNIHATSRLSPPELSRVVSTAVSQVLQIEGHTVVTCLTPQDCKHQSSWKLSSFQGRVCKVADCPGLFCSSCLVVETGNFYSYQILQPLFIG